MDSLFLIKIGGNIIDDEAKLSVFLKNFAAVKEKKILVHGGGKLATRLADQLGLKQQMIEGRRITDAETLKIVTMVYAGYINKNIVAQLQAYGCNAIGITGADANTVVANKRGLNSGIGRENVDYGFAGDVDAGRLTPAAWQVFLNNNLIPVAAPITHDGNGQLLNTNADTMAQEIAKALSTAYNVQLIYTFEKSGVLSDAEDDTTVIPAITPAFYQQLKQEQKIFAGMIPKLDNAFTALGSGINKVIIGKAEQLTELINGTKGTAIINE